MNEVVAWAIFIGYFALIFASFAFVFASIVSQKSPKALLEGKPFLFVRVAIGALVCTWIFMFKFMAWSYAQYARGQEKPTLGQWLVNTSLFEQAWRAVCDGVPQWWWSSFICTAAVFFCAAIYYQSAHRNIRYPLAYMVLGQLVAISVAIALFITAIYTHEPTSVRPKAGVVLWSCLLGALVTMVFMPSFASTDKFMPALLAIHSAVMIPLLFIPRNGKVLLGMSWRVLIPILAVLSAVVGLVNTDEVIRKLARRQSVVDHLIQIAASHPAQSSVSFDVVWVAIGFLIWYILHGSTLSVILKCCTVAAAAVGVLIHHVGVNWALVGSVLPILALLGVGLIHLALIKLRSRNASKRAAVLGKLGFQEVGVIPGTATEPPHMAKPRLVVGFWHPYCNAGGGGERVLWTAIQWVQREFPGVISLVYSGDYPEASKEEILSKIQDRFSIELNPATLAFVPLPSRYLISDNYWKRFTLLGQSLGSVYLAFEGLCGKDGVWGDMFLDTMGYAFTLPFVKLITGGEVAIGTYTHYPTVSADMVKRVRERVAGVENNGAAKSTLRTWAKLVYYRIFTMLYANALLFSEYTMTNSSWTQAHIQSLLGAGRRSLLSKILLTDGRPPPRRQQNQTGQPEPEEVVISRCEVVYPPCDTTELAKLGQLESRNREIVSLAQFRPEKEHAKQLHALATLFERHPEYRSGESAVHLTLIGGSRGPSDEARLTALRELALELGLSDNVTFLVNAPYSEVVRQLGRASIGLNTMQDEHFGINVVEFMAAGLIPVVHASAGPLLDIVVPYNGQRTGFHATDAASFADALHEALSLSPAQALEMRQAARALASEKFSEAAFEAGFAKGFESLFRHVLAVERQHEPEVEAALKVKPKYKVLEGTRSALPS